MWECMVVALWRVSFSEGIWSTLPKSLLVYSLWSKICTTARNPCSNGNTCSKDLAFQGHFWHHSGVKNNSKLCHWGVDRGHWEWEEWRNKPFEKGKLRTVIRIITQSTCAVPVYPLLPRSGTLIVYPFIDDKSLVSWFHKWQPVYSFGS